MSHAPWRNKAIVLFLLLLLIRIFVDGTKSLYTQNALSDQEKNQARLQFNQFAEEEYLHSKNNQSGLSDNQKKFWHIESSSSYGYDSNVNLDSSKVSDGFLEETIDADLKFDHKGIPGLVGEGRWGVGAAADFFNYSSIEDNNYASILGRSFFESKIFNAAKFRLNYEFNFIDYFNNDRLSYYSHKLKPVLQIPLNSQWTLSPYSSVELKDFDSRKALAANNVDSSDNRQDYLYDAGASLRFMPGPGKVCGVTLGYKRNDANDLFEDFNDYQGTKASFFGLVDLFDKISLILHGGYNTKKYDYRTFSSASTKTQRDEFYYAGGYFYYDLCPNWQLVVSNLYKKNLSNDSTQEYSAYSLTAGLQLSV